MTVKEAVRQLIETCERECIKGNCPFTNKQGECYLYSSEIGEIPAYWPDDLESYVRSLE